MAQSQADKARETAQKALEASGGTAAQAAASDPRSPEERATGARQEEDDLARDTAAMQARSGTEGLKPDEPKDTMLASPGAQFDPARVARLPAGITSGPSNQPLPVSVLAPSKGPDPYEFEEGENSTWGRDERTGRVIRPRTYPEITEPTDMLVTKSAYHADTIRNEGEIMRGYTGPLASWMQPLDGRGQPIPRERYKKAA